uniref:Macro domain-containing protein n=1 Tax=Noctiluca scintillans TaxID=2966 RepID=A0A7S1AGW8_NOCSC|mmetsp:Transcript_45493/g.120699  ORF Transcript_45493/g.120699 Transcript_45493/m.120699 type:complete len:377 (+) Transcript_45493:79-1209(+)
MKNVRLLWVAYGAPGTALASDAKAVLHDLQESNLNGSPVTVVGWDANSQRFVVKQSDGSSIKVRASTLRPAAYPVSLPDWANAESPFGPLPVDVALTAAHCLPARGIASLSSTCRALRVALWLRPEADPFWELILVRGFGRKAVEVAQRARPVTGVSLFRGARALRQLFRESFEVVRGGIQEQRGMEVVACPCMRELHDAGSAAQAVIRRCAGPQLEEAVSMLDTPLPEMAVRLVPGGSLAQRVAMTVTELPMDLWDELQGERESRISAIIGYLDRLHSGLLRAVRAAGFRTLAMPTLCTGGIGMPAHLVAIAAVKAAQRDFCEHPNDPIWVRVACYEIEHIPAFNMIKEEVLRNFFVPEEVDRNFMAVLSGDAGS